MKASRAEWQAAYRARSTAVGDGHRTWQGTCASSGVPLVFVRKERMTVARAAFLLAHGREPVGYVKAGCEWPGCVEGLHLMDRLMRDARRDAEREARRHGDVDEVAVELAVGGQLRSRRLNPVELRLAVVLAPVDLSAERLARRIGVCQQTVLQIRAGLGRTEAMAS